MRKEKKGKRARSFEREISFPFEMERAKVRKWNQLPYLRFWKREKHERPRATSAVFCPFILESGSFCGFNSPQTREAPQVGPSVKKKKLDYQCPLILYRII